ncbi:hypothetical protein [Nonomuraea sp. NEAU-A123]|uniref:hypothetical protein n=1 Tax=Nonomuraea sp. NEAU-A123 TaxID=2839649 RepID=UPI001BE46E97|nr:hypothetical protein [Nonomuraea sp. NEAU-A123]MBT2229013.1 hypothetical protein [Nonomuraea sp. NEAU-A123]
MTNGDDLDARFNELVAQIDADEQRRMRAAATRGSRPPRSDKAMRPLGRARRGLLATAAVITVIAAAGAIVAFRPDLLSPSGQPAGPIPEETQPVIAAPAGVQTATSAATGTEPAAQEPTGTQTETLAATGTQTGAPGEETAADPFAGSPAEKYAEGAAGFVMPKAKAIGGVSKKDVAKALDRTRDLMAAAYLDHKALMGGKPSAFMKLLDREQRVWYRKNLDRKKPDKDDFDSRGWVISFAPKTAQLATDVIKVSGRTTLAKARKYGRTGALLKLNHLVVYAVHRPGQPATTVRLVAHPTGSVFVYREAGELVLWLESWGASSTPARCDVDDAFIHPSYADSAPDAVGASGPPSDPYDLHEEEDRKDECRASDPT